MTLAAAARTVFIAILVMLAVPVARADVSVRFGLGHHPHAFHHRGHGSGVILDRGVMHKRPLLKRHQFLEQRHSVIRRQLMKRRHLANRHRFDRFDHAPRIGSVFGTVYAHKLFHRHRRFTHRPKVLIVPAPRVVIIDRTRTLEPVARDDRTHCREFRQKIMVDGVEQDAFGTVCRMPDGSWRFVD